MDTNNINRKGNQASGTPSRVQCTRPDIIPAMDIIEGRCVRLQQGRYDRQTTYSDSPLEVARIFEDHGITRLHLVDLEGAALSGVVHLPILETIATKTNLIIDFGGGVKSDEDIRRVFDAGAQQVTAGSIAVTSPETVARWTSTYGPDRIILGADVRDGRIATHGWKRDSGQELLGFLDHYLGLGLRTVICTDISRDGMLNGSSRTLYADLMKQFPKVRLIASGGVHSMDEVRALAELGVFGVIIGRAIYEGAIPLAEIRDFMEQGLPAPDATGTQSEEEQNA